METRPPNIEGRAYHGPRPGSQWPAHAARPDHRGRSPRRRGPGHAASDEHGPRRRDDHGPRQQPTGRLGAAGNDGLDGGAGSSLACDPRTNRLRPASGRPRATVQDGVRAWRASRKSSAWKAQRPSCRTSFASSSKGGHRPKDVGAADCRRVRRHRHRPAHHGRAARAGDRD